MDFMLSVPSTVSGLWVTKVPQMLATSGVYCNKEAWQYSSNVDLSLIQGAA